MDGVGRKEERWKDIKKLMFTEQWKRVETFGSDERIPAKTGNFVAQEK